MSVRNRILPKGNQRVFGATVIASVMMFGVACHNGVESPTSPSTTTGFVPTATSADLADDGDTATTRGGPMSYAMSGPGMSGACTLGPGGAGFRIKASGQGAAPGQQLRFFLMMAPTPTDPYPGAHTDFTQADGRGNFRFGGERVTFIDSGRAVTCMVTPHPGATVLAQSDQFTIP